MPRSCWYRSIDSNFRLEVLLAYARCIVKYFSRGAEIGIHNSLEHFSRAALRKWRYCALFDRLSVVYLGNEPPIISSFQHVQKWPIIAVVKRQKKDVHISLVELKFFVIRIPELWCYQQSLNWPHISIYYSMKCRISSTGRGKIMVEFFSALNFSMIIVLFLRVNYKHSATWQCFQNDHFLVHQRTRFFWKGWDRGSNLCHQKNPFLFIK